MTVSRTVFDYFPLTQCESGAGSVVSSGWRSAQQYANSSFNSANRYLSQFQSLIDPNVSTNIPNVNVSLNIPDIDVADIVIPELPGAPSLEMNFPLAPTAPVIPAVTPITPPAVPEFIANYPTITLPAKPTPISATPPSGAPSYIIPVTPDSPDLVIPLTPSLRELALPQAPVIDLPEFVQAVPDDTLVAPEAQLSWNEEVYASTLLDSINSTFINS